MHADEVDIDAELVARLVASQFPAWADLPVEEVASADTVNAIYRLGNELMVCLPRAHTYATDVVDDLQVLVPLAGRLPLEIPTILAIGRPAQSYPFPWGIYRWIDGTSWSTRPTEDLNEAAEDLARFALALQAVDPSGAPGCDRFRMLWDRQPHRRVLDGVEPLPGGGAHCLPPGLGGGRGHLDPGSGLGTPARGHGLRLLPGVEPRVRRQCLEHASGGLG